MRRWRMARRRLTRQSVAPPPRPSPPIPPPPEHRPPWWTIEANKPQPPKLDPTAHKPPWWIERMQADEARRAAELAAAADRAKNPPPPIDGLADTHRWLARVTRQDG